MVINGKPALACETFLRDLKGKDIEIRPLRKFPVIHDLVIDRSSIHKNLKQANSISGNTSLRKTVTTLISTQPPNA